MFENVKQNPFRRINFGKLPKTNPVPPSGPSNRGNFPSTVFVPSRFKNVKQNLLEGSILGNYPKGILSLHLGLAIKGISHLLYLSHQGLRM